MNARQKAKYYKRKYEELASCPIIPQVYTYTHHIDTLKFEKYYPDTVAIGNEEHFKRIAISDFTKYITERLEDYTVFRMDYNPEFYQHRVIGEIKVVRP